LWQAARAQLRARGLWPLPDEAFQGVEGRLAGALPPVEASPRFREALAANLDLLAQHRRSGVIVKAEAGSRRGALVGLGIASLAAAAALVTLVVYLSRGVSRHPAQTG